MEPNKPPVVQEPASRNVAVHGDSRSGNAPGIRASLGKLIWKSKISIVVTAIFAALTIYVFQIGEQFFNKDQVSIGAIICIGGLILGFIALVSGFVVYSNIKGDQLAIEKGLLTPGLVSSDQRFLICMTNISMSSAQAIYAIKKIKYRARKNEHEVPCSSTFFEEVDGRHNTFFPIPLWWGSSDTAGIEQCRQNIGPEMWAGIKKVVASTEIPDVDRMLLLDENFNVIENVPAYTPEDDDQDTE